VCSHPLLRSTPARHHVPVRGTHSWEAVLTMQLGSNRPKQQAASQGCQMLAARLLPGLSHQVLVLLQQACRQGRQRTANTDLGTVVCSQACVTGHPHAQPSCSTQWGAIQVGSFTPRRGHATPLLHHSSCSSVAPPVYTATTWPSHAAAAQRCCPALRPPRCCHATGCSLLLGSG
jgi:hypothetical protein